MYSNDDGSLSSRLLSMGEGIEREAVYYSFNKYHKEQDRWFMLCSDNYSTVLTTQSCLLSMTHGSFEGVVSSTRLELLSVLGALTSLMLLYRTAPTPLSPAFLQLLLHNGDFQSLTSSFIQEWHPQLYRTLNKWKSTEFLSSDISEFDTHFQLYHDFPVSYCF